MSPKVKRGLQKAPKDGSKLSAALQPEKLRSRNGGAGGLCCLCPAVDQLQNIRAFLEANRENRGEAEVGKMCPTGREPSSSASSRQQGWQHGEGQLGRHRWHQGQGLAAERSPAHVGPKQHILNIIQNQPCEQLPNSPGGFFCLLRKGDGKIPAMQCAVGLGEKRGSSTSHM